MIRITKLTDYGILLLSHIAQEPGWRTQSVKELSLATRLPEPTVSKLLKSLTRTGILVSQRGSRGGYTLSRRPSEISVAQIIGAIDGPIAITDCSSTEATRCELENRCPVRSNWQKINLSIRDSLERVSLADMARPQSSEFVPIASIKLDRHEVAAK